MILGRLRAKHRRQPLGPEDIKQIRSTKQNLPQLPDEQGIWSLQRNSKVHPPLQYYQLQPVQRSEQGQA